MTNFNREEYEKKLAEAGAFHGDICAGIRIGVRMTLCGLGRIGVADPKGADRKKIMVFVEIDRCATDAIMALTGCRPGKRTMKVYDYGKMAATFLNLGTMRAVRVAARMSKDAAIPLEEQLATAEDEEIFSIQEVRPRLRDVDMPGKPLRRIVCAQCGDSVMDGRDVLVDGRALCAVCASGEGYYEAAPVAAAELSEK